MTRETIDFGIDLGTTNSAIAVLNGTDVQVIKNNDQAEFTPSAVWITRSNNIYIGDKAKSRIEADPQNAHGEFKLQMGVEDSRVLFEAAGCTMGPEELSAEVLKSLKRDVAQRLNEDLQAAVITVPAAFELNQCDATRRAARLAGFTFAPLLQEPTAAALAHGFHSDADDAFWLVYDFGGGTFDAAVIHAHDGEFTVVNHCGDNFLGGKLIDWAIVEQILIPAVVREHRLPDFRRGNPQWRGNMAKLKGAAEVAKISLSSMESVDVMVDLEHDNRDRLGFDYELRRADVARLSEPLHRRAVNLCRKALAEARLAPGDIEKVLLVGGATLAPQLREHLADPQEGLGIPLDLSLDPITVVACGAAIFAGTQRPPRPKTAPKPGQFAIDLEFEPLGSELEPLVGGKVRSAALQDWAGFRIEFTNSAARPPWSSGDIDLSPTGMFTTRLLAEEAVANTFSIELRDPRGTRQPINPDRLTYTHTTGTVMSEAVLTHSIGVGLADQEMQWFLEKGTALPARKRVVLETAIDVRRGETGGLLRIPVIEGERPRADRNRVIGTLAVQATDIPRDLAAGSEVEVTIDIDASRLIKTTAFIPILDEEYEQPIDLGKSSPPDTETLRRAAEGDRQRLDELRRQAAAVGADKPAQLLDELDGERIVEDIDELVEASSVDRDAAAACEKRQLDLAAALDDVEDALALPELIEDVAQTRRAIRELVDAQGEERDRQQLSECERKIDDAVAVRDTTMLRSQHQALSEMAYRILDRSGQLPLILFDEFKGESAGMTDQRRAQRLIAEGEAFIARGDIHGLRGVNTQLRSLLPKSFDPLPPGRISDVRQTFRQQRSTNPWSA